VVYWSAPPRDLVERRERLRVFAPWAAEALGQAQDRARAEELLRRVKVLQQATGDLAATDDVKVIHETCIRAVRTGLGAAASLVERASGRVLAGDAEVTEALVRWTVDGGAVPVEVGAVASQSKAPVATKLGENLVLLTWRASPRLDELDATWVEQLAMVVRAALERCAVYQNLREAEHQLRASLEAAPAPVAVWDANGKLVMANVAYLALDLNAPPPRGVPPAGIHEEEVLSGDPPRTFVAMTSVVPDGQYVVSVLREITRERQALQAKDDLIALVGHELRSPLTTIRGYSQMMARQLDVVQQQVGQLNQLIGDFMDASRLEGGQLPLAREPVDVVGLIRATAEVFSGAYEGRVLRLRVPESVPFVEGDRARLGQVLDNLLSNAAKYSAPETEIKLVVEVVDSQIRIAVQDKGIGIAAEHMPRLFTRFYRVPGAAAGRVSGYGLGLSIVRDLVAAHGGRVWAESPGPGQGSTFWVSLPVWSPEKTGQLEALGAT
jgi:signal transduction histidine kinase